MKSAGYINVSVMSSLGCRRKRRLDAAFVRLNRW